LLQGKLHNRCRWLRRSIILASFIFCGGPKFVSQIIAFGEEIIDNALSFGDILAHLKFAVDTHVVDGIEFHAVWIELARAGHTTSFLDFDQTPAQSEKLVVNWQKRFRDRLRSDQKLVNVRVSAADEV